MVRCDLETFKGNNSGGLGSLAALLIATLLIAGAGYVDFRRLNNVQDELQAAADVAALDGASLMSARAESRETNARAIFDRHYEDPPEFFTIDKRDAIAKNGTVTVTASANVPMMFLKYVGQKTRRVSVEATAPYGGPNEKGEIAI